ncbi:MAG: DUF3187 family protein [Desulfobacteraceae bacterium]
MRSNLKVLAKLLFLGILLHPFFCAADQLAGPLRVLNQFPPHMMFLTPMPRAPKTLSEKTIAVDMAIDYFSIFYSEASSDYRILMDMEAVVADLRLGYGITDNFSLGIRCPFVSMGDGFLDNFLEQYHQTFGLPNYGKEHRPYDKFDYTIKKEHNAWFDAQKEGLNLLDPTLTAQIELLHLQQHIPITIGMIYDIKLPLGDKTSGFGSGSWDYGVFFPIQFNLSNTTNIYVMPGYIHVGTPDLQNTSVPVRDIKSFFLGGEYRFTSKTSILVQISSYTSPYINTGIGNLDSPSVELAFGMRWSLTDQIGIELSFSEDLTRSVPDFNLHGMVSCKFY